MVKFILLSGKAGAGKDTVGAMIADELMARDQVVLVTHFADLLKFMCASMFGWDGNKDASGRSLLQYVGTDIVRKENPNYWVDYIISLANLFPHEWDYIIIPDTRFLNEINRVRGRGYPAMHIRILGEERREMLGNQKLHSSETFLDNVRADCGFYNTEPLDEVGNMIPTLVDHIERWFDGGNGYVPAKEVFEV